MISAADESRHAPGLHPLWEESWYFDFAAADGSVGGYVRLGLVPREGTTWFWAAVAGPGRPPVVLRDHDVEPPRGRALEARASGLWVDLVCETPVDHWSVGLEAFGVALDDPADAYRGERGDRTALGLDLEWEAAGPPGDAGQLGGEAGYGHHCIVHGDVLVGRERIALDGNGYRSHRWGGRDWWAAPRSWAAATFADGRTVAGHPDGAVVLGGEGIPTSATVVDAGDDVRVDVLAAAPLLVPGRGGGAPSRLPRALCRFQRAGTTGHGWAEWLQPGGPPPPTA